MYYKINHMVCNSREQYIQNVEPYLLVFVEAATFFLFENTENKSVSVFAYVCIPLHF